MRATIRVVVLSAVAVLAPVSLTGAGGYLDIDGIDGDSQNATYHQTVEIEEFHHLVTRVPGAPGEETHETVVFVKKRNESSTVDLFQRLHSGQVLPRMEFYFTFLGGEHHDEWYLHLDLRDAHVVAIEPWSRGDTDEDQFERVRVDYGRITVHYRELGPGGGVVVDEQHEIIVGGHS